MSNVQESRPSPHRQSRRGVGAQSIALAGSTALAQGIVAVLYVVGARNASPETFGLIVAAVALGTAAAGFVDFGTNSLWIRELATGRMGAEAHGRRLVGKVVFTILLGMMWVGVSVILFPGALYWTAAPIAVATVLYQSLQVPLRHLARGDLVSLTILVERVAALLAFSVLILAGVEAVHCLWFSLVTGSVAAGVMALMLTPRIARPVLRIDLKENPWASAGHFGLANMALSAKSLDTPLMASFGGPAAAGIYGAVSRWTQPMGLLANAFSSASAPYMARASSAAAAWNHVKRTLWLPAVAILACVVVAALAGPIVDLLIGRQYRESGLVLQILAIGTIPAIINQPLFMLAQARRLDKPVSVLVVATVLAQLGFVALLSVPLGAVGAALAAAGSQVVLFVSLAVLLVLRRKELFAGEENFEKG